MFSMLLFNLLIVFFSIPTFSKSSTLCVLYESKFSVNNSTVFFNCGIISPNIKAIIAIMIINVVTNDIGLFNFFHVLVFFLFSFLNNLFSTTFSNTFNTKAIIAPIINGINMAIIYFINVQRYEIFIKAKITIIVNSINCIIVFLFFSKSILTSSTRLTG